MIIGYVRKHNRQYEKKIEVIRKIIRMIFLKVKIERIGNDVMFLLPNYKKYNKILLKIFSWQINMYAKRFNINQLIIEKDLQFPNECFRTTFKSNGKLIMRKKMMQIFEYIFSINKENINLENVYVLVNEYTKQNIYAISKLVETFKTVNIVTENLRRFRMLENSLFSKGILITVSNNKRKSLKNAKYIINIDFDKIRILMYNIKSNSIIINLADEDIKLKNNFNGVLVNNFELEVNSNKTCFINEFYGNIDVKIFLEMMIKRNIKNLEYIKEIDEEYSTKIKCLTGVRGRLENNEFLI